MTDETPPITVRVARAQEGTKASELASQPKRRRASAASAAYLKATKQHAEAAVREHYHDWYGTPQRKDAVAQQAELTRPLTLDECRDKGIEAELLFYPDASSEVRLVDTRLSPSVLTAEATRDHLDLANRAGCLDVALDADRTVQPNNSVERMLVFQMAAVHTLGMRMAERAAERLDQPGPMGTDASIEASRLANTAARMFSAYTEAALALQKLRSGGHQAIRVLHQHVQVGQGNVAVAGTVVPGAGDRKRRGATSK